MPCAAAVLARACPSSGVGLESGASFSCSGVSGGDGSLFCWTLIWRCLSARSVPIIVVDAIMQWIVAFTAAEVSC